MASSFYETYTAIAPLLAGGSMMDVDLLAALRMNDVVGWACLVFIGAFSVASWWVIIPKALRIWRAQKQTEAFEQRCKAARGDIHAAFLSTKQYPDSPLATLLHDAYVEIELEGLGSTGAALPPEERNRRLREELDRTLNQCIDAEVRELESKTSILSTTANVCPFVGLLGTVWGILGAFQAVGVAQSASIQAIAPGVSTALVTTVAGLVAAIPAVIAYNLIASRTQAIAGRMDSFASDLTALFLRQTQA